MCVPFLDPDLSKITIKKTIVEFENILILEI